MQDVRQKQQQWQHLRTQATVCLWHLQCVVESAKWMTFNADLEMAWLLRGLKEQGFIVELSHQSRHKVCVCALSFSITYDFIEYVVSISGGVGMLRAILD